MRYFAISTAKEKVVCPFNNWEPCKGLSCPSLEEVEITHEIVCEKCKHKNKMVEGTWDEPYGYCRRCGRY